ncbi:hypothetical protein [Streptomyces sp. H34-S4]|uniref:hypothetical protein n=1 Tax=Streptomyces sp. H34-S4 TaxID=2996463 RepID=UPI00226D8208|nr:hypothetical protein [Streptomyces sp. H34-S4]MCY0935930.1 hypothetical protein [Streptomyces sp. H34-S4]
MIHTASRQIAEHIEFLYGRPHAELEAHAESTTHPNMLSALLAAHGAIEFAERDLDFQLQRLRKLTQPEREVGRYDAGHIYDCARRIGEAVAVRDTQARHVSAVLQSLHRTPAPEATPAALVAPPVLAAAPATRAR